MAKAIPNPDMPHAGGGAKPMPTANHDAVGAKGEGAYANLRLWGLENPLQSEPAENSAGRSLLATLADDGLPTVPSGADVNLVNENLQLRGIIEELRANLEQAGRQGENAWQARQKEYENLLQEKSELIRTLHVRIQESQDAHPPAPATPKEEELLAFSEELERERCRLKQDQKGVEELRQRLTEDEQEMLHQMRDVEVQMARERADFARQRTELQRILDDIRRELENVERNGLLNQRLGQLRQRFQDVAIGRSGEPKAPAPVLANTPAVVKPTNKNAEKSPRKDSGLLQRFFGKGER